MGFPVLHNEKKTGRTDGNTQKALFFQSTAFFEGLGLSNFFALCCET